MLFLCVSGLTGFTRVCDGHRMSVVSVCYRSDRFRLGQHVPERSDCQRAVFLRGQSHASPAFAEDQHHGCLGHRHLPRPSGRHAGHRRPKHTVTCLFDPVTNTTSLIIYVTKYADDTNNTFFSRKFTGILSVFYTFIYIELV